MQSTLFFPRNKDFSEENFVFLNENSKAKNILEKFFTQSEFSAASFSSLILKGEAACGKTHLLNIFAQKKSAKLLTKDDILQKDLLKNFIKNDFYIFEDADEIADDELLLRLINSAFEAKSFLIISLKNFSKFKLKDLVSRLRNIFLVEIESLKDESIRQLIVNDLARKQIKLSLAMIEFISANVGRSHLALHDVVNKVENLCHQKKGEISIKDLKALLL